MIRKPADRSQAPHKTRRALSSIGGRVETRGEPTAAAALASAFGGDHDADDARQHVHGFHSYPARLHPTVARRAIELFAAPGGIVLDPFCGSGTVLVEARLAGRTAWGADINPLAVLLARLKCRGASADELERLLRASQAVAKHAEQRRLARAGATRRYPETDIKQFDPHVLLELDGLRDGIDRGPAGFSRDTLWLVLSSILTKLARRSGDTGGSDDPPKRIAAGFPSRLFVRKTEELCRQITDFVKRLPAPPPRFHIEACDARRMAGFEAGCVDLVVTSPPYPGNYDYLSHHQTRMRWLGLDERELASQEIGARRLVDPADPERAIGAFASDLSAVLKSVSRLLRPGARALFVIADSVVHHRPVRAEPLMQSVARVAGFRWVATASQARPHFHRETARAFARAPRAEHAILLEWHADRDP